MRMSLIIFSLLFVCMLLLIPFAYSETVSVNYSITKGTLHDYAYGVNTHGIWGNPYSWIDTNHDGTLDTRSDHEWHREVLSNASINYWRADMYLELISNSDGTFKNTSTSNHANIEARRALVEYAYNNSIKVLWIAGYMPSWLSDGAATCTTNTQRCNPSNYTRWGELVVDFLDAVGCDDYPGTCWVEVWNEPDLYIFFHPDGDCGDRVSGYNRLYNVTYDAIKASNMSEILVGGPSVSDSADDYWSTSVCGWNITRSWLYNFTSPLKYDYISYHDYWNGVSTVNYEVRTEFKINGIDQHLTAAGAPLSTLRVVSEWQNHYVGGHLNNDSNITYQLALFLVSNFNPYPNNTITVYYQHQEECEYGNYACYDQYPYRFAWVSEPGLDDVLYAGYNVTKAFGTYHPPGADIVYTAENTNLRILCSNNTYSYHCSIINKNAGSISVDLSIDGLDVVNATHTNGTVYTVSSGSVNLGYVSARSVNHYTLNIEGSCDNIDKKVMTSFLGFSWYNSDTDCSAAGSAHTETVVCTVGGCS